MSDFIGGLEPVRVDGDPNDYRIGHLASADASRPHRVVLTIMPFDNTRNAAAVCTDLIRSFSGVHSIIMTGVAGGIPNVADPERHVRRGDIVVATDGIVDYGHIRSVSGGIQLRRAVSGISMELLRAARELQVREVQGRRLWDEEARTAHPGRSATFRRPAESADVLLIRGEPVAHPNRNVTHHPVDRPKVHYGAIGCADILLRNEQQRDELAATHRFIAVEMEGSGIAAAAVLHGIHWFMVRGIADYCDDLGKDNRWHGYASYMAASYVTALLSVCPPFPSGQGRRDSRVLALLEEGERRRLGELLRQVTDVNLPSLWHAAAGDLAPLPPTELLTIEQVFDHLATINADVDGLPPALLLIERLADRVNDDLAQDFRTWNDEQATRLNILAALHVRRAQGQEMTDDDGAEPGLLIRIVPDGINSQRCAVNYWIQYRLGPWRPRPGDAPIELPIAMAEQAVETLVHRAETAWRENIGAMTIEFILPLELIDLPVEWWRTETGSSNPPALCLDYKVVVRSLDRMQAQSRRRMWVNRWNAMFSEPTGHRVHWGSIGSAPVDLDRWDAELRTDDSITSVVLSAPPSNARGHTELVMALRAGIPVVMWDRREPRPARSSTIMRTLMAADPADLPTRLNDVRAAAARTRNPDRQNHAGKYLALLWDDPRRLLESGKQINEPDH